MGCRSHLLSNLAYITNVKRIAATVVATLVAIVTMILTTVLVVSSLMEATCDNELLICN